MFSQLVIENLLENCLPEDGRKCSQRESAKTTEKRQSEIAKSIEENARMLPLSSCRKPSSCQYSVENPVLASIQVFFAEEYLRELIGTVDP